MSLWKPSLRTDVDLRHLPLTPEEGFVASRLDGQTDLHGLCLLTGFQPERVDAALTRLALLGAVVPDPAFAPAKTPPPPSIAPVTLAEVTPRPRTTTPRPPTPLPPQELDASEEETEAVDAGAEPEPSEATVATHRKLFETVLHPLPEDQRAVQVRTAEDPELSAFCYDSSAIVAHAILENQRFGLVHARLLAKHHPTSSGLEALGTRAAFTADSGVRRALVRNPLLPAGLFRRLYAARRLLEQYQLALSREIPEQTRRTARELLRQRFSSAASEEKVELILKTEARCVALLSGLGLDGKSSALLCGRPYASVTLVQNLARWGATPPPLIAHLLRQEVVRRNTMLRNLLVRHLNTPTELRR